MGTFSMGHWLVVLVVVLIVFGAGRLPKTRGDRATGVRAFRAGLRSAHADAAGPARAAPAAAAPTPLPSQGGHAPAGAGAAVAAGAGRVEVRGD